MSENKTPVQQIMDETPDNLSIIFNEEAQNAILGHLIQNQKFFVQSLGKIRPEYFNNPYSNQILSVQLDLYQKLKRFPSTVEISNHENVKAKAVEDQIKIEHHLIEAIEAAKQVGVDFLKPKLTDWLHQLLLKKFLRDSLQKYGNSGFKNIFYEMDTLKKTREDFSYEDTQEVSFDNSEEWLQDSEINFDQALPTGLKALDQALLEGATNGSLLPGDTTCFMSPTDGGKCLGKDTPVMMSDGSIKMVQDVKMGELLMGPDGKARKVLGTTKGHGQLYKVSPKSGGEPFVCNDVHVLSLKSGWDNTSRDRKGLKRWCTMKKGEVVNIPLNEFLNKSKDYQRRMHLWRVGLDFKEKELPLDPYLLGLWLGDGTSSAVELTTADREIFDIWNAWGKSLEGKVSSYGKVNNKAKTHRITKAKTNVRQLFRDMGILNNKRIPRNYLMSSAEQRLNLLAGIIDTDGHLASNLHYELTTVSKALSEDYAFLARSLGFKVRVTKTRKGCQTGAIGTYYRLYIAGKITQVPVILDRKRATIDNDREALATSFTVEDLGLGDYYGFELGGDHLFLLGDFTVTHNTSTAFTVTCHNILAGKDVLLMTHEGRPQDLRERLLVAIITLMGLHGDIEPFEGNPFITRLGLIKMNKTPQGRETIKHVINDLIKKHLVYYPYNKPGMLIEEVEPIIRRQQDKRVTLTQKGFDLLVNDYPAKLGSRRGSQGFMPHHIELGNVYDYFVQLSIEFSWHSLLAVQTNREGYKTNNRNVKAENSRLLTIDDVADAYIISNLMTNFISINRDPVSAQQDRITYYVCKSKNSKTGRAIVAKSKFSSRITHDDTLGAIAYDDNVMFGNEMELILSNKENHGKILSTQDVLQYGVTSSTIFESGGTA